MVLLKNDGTLPLGSNVKKIAVVGPLADSVRVLLGNYSGTPSRSTTVLDGIRKQFASARVTFALGMNFLREDKVIPAALFSTDDGQAGIKGEYFPNKQFKGPPLVVRRDRYINLDPLPHTPQSLTQPEGLTDFSILWTGVLTPDESAIYQLSATGTKDQIWLDGRLIADDSGSQVSAPAAAIIRLEKGHHYALRVESVVQDDGGASLKWLPLRPHLKEEALAAAQQADVVIAVVGITSQLEGEELRVNVPGFNGGDRTGLNLPDEEEQLIEAIKGTGKPLIVVLVNGSALSVNWAKEHANAILEAWYPGEEGGTAIAETLAGINNPAGRLPVTFYKGIEQLPAFADYSMKNRTYRYFHGEPLYPFGFGLSYSRFEYNGLKLSAENLSAGESLELEVDVRNNSKIPGDEIVQSYLDFPPMPGAPLRALRGFQRIHLAAGESRRVRFKLSPRDLSFVNEAGVRSMSAGRYVVTLGGSQPGMPPTQPQAAFQINGESILPE
jgi:beta-glucosidase